MRVLIGCEYSQIVTKAFRDKGHLAYSCDILPTEGNPEWHFKEDIFEVLKREKFDLGIFHPPCTYLSNSGVRWLWNKDGSKNEERWQQMEKAAMFFRSLLNTDCDRIAVENPIPHKYALEIIGEKYSQIIQPYQFGHGETKATCLWLKGLPPLMSTDNVSGREQRIWKLPPSPDRWKERSRTFAGIGKAIAGQWSNLEKKDLIVKQRRRVPHNSKRIEL